MRSDELDPALAALSALSQAAHQSHDAQQLYSHDQLASFAQLSASFAPPAPPPPPAVATRSRSPSQANIPVDSGSDAGDSDSSVPIASTSAAVPAAATAAAAPANKRKLRSLVPNGPPPPPPPPQQPSRRRASREILTVAEKAALRKERNRIAAQKSRDKRQHEFDEVVADRDKWRQKAMRLEQEVAQLKLSFDRRLRDAKAEWEAQLPLEAPSPDEIMPPEDLNFV
ncbi:hypothetical protein JCM3775_007269 [Rhodotorula graminis]